MAEKRIVGVKYSENVNADLFMDSETNQLTKAVNNVNGQEIGGGGDYTFAKITTVGPAIRMYGAFYGTVQMPGEPAMGMTMPGNSAGFDTIILYQGKAILTTDDDYETISGNITKTGDAEYLVTGDCTITNDR